jgi:transposase
MASGKLAGHDTPEKLFAELLGLRLKSGASRECVLDRSQVELHVEPTSEVWKQERCPKCGGAAKGYDRTEPLRWRHLNVMQYRCELVCRLPRGQCPKCRHTWRLLHKHVDARLCREADFSNVCCVGVRKGHQYGGTQAACSTP